MQRTPADLLVLCLCYGLKKELRTLAYSPPSEDVRAGSAWQDNATCQSMSSPLFPLQPHPKPSDAASHIGILQ